MKEKRYVPIILFMFGVLAFFAPILDPGSFTNDGIGIGILLGVLCMVSAIYLAYFKKDKVKRCLRCGNLVPEDANYCDRCGAITR